MRYILKTKSGKEIEKIDIAREVALKILYDIDEKGAYSNISINRYFSGNKLKDLDKTFITELVYGTIKRKLTLDWVIGKFSSIKLSKISPWIINILRMGTYQLLFTDKIPETAACNESVKLAKRYGHSASSGFVNAILRNIAKNKSNIKYPEKDKDILKFLSVKYSYPEWIIKKWIDSYGESFTEELLISNNETPELSIRVNTNKISRDDLIEELHKSGYDTIKGKYINESLIIKNPDSIANMESYKKGFFQVQDESSMLVAKVLDPKPGELVIDVCSAPGGKATHIAELMKNKGMVIARDIHEHKIKLIESASKRLGLENIRTELFDATTVDKSYIHKADRVLVDAPCTGLGIIRRKPDIKWERSTYDAENIIELQKKILHASSTYVKTGGTLVYSTCTINHDENEKVVMSFINENKFFKLEDISEYLPENLHKDEAKKGYMQLFPNVDRIDGFFIARLIRKE